MLGMMDKARIILDRLDNRPEGKEDVDAVRAGIPVQVGYADAEVEDGYIARLCW